MADPNTRRILKEIQQLSYTDRVKIIESVVRSLRLREDDGPKGRTNDAPEELFGMWRDREVSLEEIRERAWHRA